MCSSDLGSLVGIDVGTAVCSLDGIDVGTSVGSIVGIDVGGAPIQIQAVSKRKKTFMTERALAKRLIITFLSVLSCGCCLVVSALQISSTNCNQMIFKRCRLAVGVAVYLMLRGARSSQ